MRRQTTQNGRRRGEAGVSFMELMMATLILGTTIVGTTNSFTQSAEVYHYFSDGPHEALMLAQEIHEAAILLPWDSEAGDPALYGEDVYTLWDFDDQSYSPPRSAEYEAVISHNGWSQDVVVRHVSLDDPTVEVDPLEFEGDMLVELIVTVNSGQTSMGEFSWWMTEPDAKD